MKYFEVFGNENPTVRNLRNDIVSDADEVALYERKAERDPYNLNMEKELKQNLDPNSLLSLRVECKFDLTTTIVAYHSIN